MSALPQFAPTTAPRPSPSRAPSIAPRPRLLLVRAPAHERTRVPFVLLCMAILASALLGALLLNTSMARGAYEAHDLEVRLASLARDEQSLSTAKDAKASPAQLAASATALGMVPAPGLAFLRLSDGAVLGKPAVAK
jgi:hypothetical protein